MPSLSAQRDAALLILQTYVLPDIPPTISTETLGQILDATRRATIWEADTEYFYGDVILPTVRNGHAYQCTQHGTSGATEPVWPTGNGSTITDGESDPLLDAGSSVPGTRLPAGRYSRLGPGRGFRS